MRPSTLLSRSLTQTSAGRRRSRPIRNTKRRVVIEPLEDRTVPAVTLIGLPDWADQGSKPMTDGADTLSTSAPGNPSSGAVEAVAVDPNNSAHIFVGAVNGGIWVTTNGNRPFNGIDDDGVNGVDDALEQPTWTPLTDDFPSLAIGDVRFSPLDATGNTVFAGTGSASSLLSSGGQAIGVFRTTDGGATWTLTPLNPGGGEPQIRAVLPTTFDADPGTAGVQQVILVGVNGNPGMYRSANGGTSYTPVTAASGLPGGAVTDIIADPNNGSRYYAGVVGVGVFVSTDGGLNWAPTDNADLTNVGTSTVIQLSAHPGGGATVLHALVGGPNPGVFTSNDGNNWAPLAALPAGFNSGNNGLYTQAASDQLVVDPTNSQIVYVSKGYGGSPFMWRYDPVGVTWVDIEEGGSAGATRPHVDNRDLQFAGNNVLIAANDGGIYFMPNPQNAAANSWVSLHGRGADGLGITENHDVAWDSRFDVATAANQDNGTTVQNGTGDPVWTLYLGADGGDVKVDTVNAGAGRSFRYASSQNFGSLNRHTFDSATNQPIPSVGLFPAGGLAGFNAPFVPAYELNVVNMARLVTGATGPNPVYELTNATTAPNAAGATWVAVPIGAGFAPQLDNNNNPIPGSFRVDGGFAVGGRLGGVDNPEVLVVGSGGRVFVRSTAGGTLTETATTFPGGTVTDIVLDPDNWQHFFVTDGTGVWETTDAGAAVWNNLTGNMAAVNRRLSSIDFVPSATGGTVLVGGNLGVSRLPLGVPGVPWTRFGLGLPNALVTDMEYNADDDVLLAGAYGRGTWTIPNVSTVVEVPGVLIISGDDLFPNQDDTFRLVRNATNPLLLEVYVNNVLQFSGPLAAIQQINVFAAGGNDRLIVDSSNGLITAPNGVRYDGDNGYPGQVGAGVGGFDRLDLVQTGGSPTGVTGTLAIGATNGSGRSTIATGTSTQRVDFENLEPVVDTVPAASFNVTSDPTLASLLQGTNTINYTTAQLIPPPAATLGGRVTVDTFEPIEFANKTSLIINAGTGHDTVNLNNPGTPTGLTGITVNAGDGDDTVTTLAGLLTGVTANGGDGNDFLSIAGAAGDGALDGGTGNDTLVGGPGDDDLTGGAGEDILDGRGGDNTLNGGVGTDTILVSGTAGADTISTTHGAGTFNITGGLSAGTNSISSMQLVRVLSGDGADDITLNLLATGGLNYTVLGGNPIGTPAGDSLTVNTAGAAAAVTPGPENDAGSVDAATAAPTNVSFDEIERLAIGGGGGGVVNGTNGDDAITVIARDGSTHAGANGVQDVTVVVNAGLEILFLNQPTLSVNALGGSDTIVLRTPAPNNAKWDVDVTVDGGPPSAGDPAGSDRMVVETPVAGAESATYTPTAADGGTLDLTTLSSLLTLTQVEELLYDGEGDNDSLTVVGTGGDDLITHTPGSTDQAGAFQVNGALPIAYSNLGAGAALTANGVGGGDTLVYQGTDADDTFTVLNAAGDVRLNSRLVLSTSGVETLTMEGLLGDDLFDIVPVVTSLVYGRVNANGGSQASATGDRTALRTTGGGDTIGISGQVVSVAGKTVASSGVERISLNAAAGMDAVTYTGVAGVAEAINFISAGVAKQGQISVPGVTLVTYSGVERLVAVGNTGADGNEDTLTVTGTNAIDQFLIHLEAAGTPADPVLRLQTAGGALLLTLVNYENFNTLRVNALDGEDLIDVFTAASGPGRNLFVDGGLPSGKKKSTDKLTVYYTPPRPRIIHSTETQDPDAGLVDLDYDSVRFLVQYDDVEEVVIKRV